MRLIAIAAMGKDRQIGLRGSLPWKIPEEYAHYQNTVKGHYLIVGRKNYESNGSDIEIGKPLILTKNSDYIPSGPGEVFTSIQQIIEFLESKGVDRAFVIGGEKIYELFMPYLDEMMLSFVGYEGEADTFFPEFNLREWKEVESKSFENYQYIHYQRINSES